MKGSDLGNIDSARADPDAARRHQVLARYRSLKAGPDERFERVAALACKLLDMPMALICLVDAERQWRKADINFPAVRNEPAQSFTRHTMLSKRVVEVPDASAHPVFRDHPLVCDAPRLTTYIGAPLIDSSGLALGALGLWSITPREFCAEQRATLVTLARLAVDAMDLYRTLDVANEMLLARHRSEALYRGIFESHGLGISLIGLDRNRISANGRYCAITGYEERELVGADYRLLPRHACGLPADTAFDDLVRGRTAVDRLEHELITKSGRRITVRKTMTVQRGPDGQPLHCVAFVEDISDIRLGERRLAVSEALFRQTFENAGAGMARIGSDGRFLAVNDRLCRLLGRDRAALLAMTHADVTHREDVAVVDAACRDLFAGRIGSCSIEQRFVRPDDEEVWGDLNFSRLPHFADEPESIIAVVQDITARKRAEATRQLLVGELNHRVKNTLTIVTGMASQTCEFARSPTEFITAFSKRLQSLSSAHDLLTAVNWSPVAIDQLIQQQVIRPFQHHAGRIKVAGEKVLVKPQVALSLGMVLFELATNAVKHGALAGSEGEVAIAFQTPSVDGKPRLDLTWIEINPRTCGPVERAGFGSFMLERGIALGLGGTCERSFGQTGFRCRISVPLY